MGDERRRQGLLGMAQRFGPYSFVVNTDKISRKIAEEQGWDLFNDPKLAGRYGVQKSDDWNVSSSSRASIRSRSIPRTR
jgi:spermidine/putrescine-binding protein